jgi:hypothetical protein
MGILWQYFLLISTLWTFKLNELRLVFQSYGYRIMKDILQRTGQIFRTYSEQVVHIANISDINSSDFFPIFKTTCGLTKGKI